MSIRNLQVLSKGDSVDLPDWIDFAFELGSYIQTQEVEKEPLTIVLSIPSEQYFPLFIAMGIANQIYSVNNKKESIKEQILGLEKGHRIIFQDKESSRRVSVLSVEPSPVFEDEMLLWIQDGQIDRRGIPERDWMDKIIILDEELDEVKRSRKVSGKQKLGLEGNKLLSALYSAEHLNKVSFYPGDYFYIVGNISKISEDISVRIFTHNNIIGSLKDFLYMDNRNSYTNGKLFSTRTKINKMQIDEEIPVIYTDLNSYIRQSKYFTENPKFIISSRSDNESRVEEVQGELKREILEKNYKMVTQELVNYLKTSNTQIPNGIEFIVWR